MTEYTKILVAIDISKEADLILKKANTFAKVFNCTLSIIHVIEPLIIDNTYEAFSLASAEMEKNLVEHSKSFQAETIKRLNINAVQMITTIGSTKHEIINTAKSNSIDLIILGTHGRHGLSRLLGSTANAVLHGAPCDVLAIKIRES